MPQLEKTLLQQKQLQQPSLTQICNAGIGTGILNLRDLMFDDSVGLM